MKKILSIIAILILAYGCKKNEKTAPDFDVTISQTTYKLGDTIHFKFSGNPESIVFWAGTAGNNYNFKDRATANGTPQLVFSTYLQNAGETNTLLLLASSDFNGSYDTVSIRKATWTDITSRAKLSTGSDNTSSGTVDLSDLATSMKPVYFAFKYQGYTSATLKQPTWTLKTFNINNVLPEGRTSAITTIDQVGWQGFSFKNPTILWTVPTSGLASINGTITGFTNDLNEDWLISRGFNLKEVSPDIPNSANGYIKNLGDKTLSGFDFKYTAAGTYLATFEAFNSDSGGKVSIARQIQITITP